MILGIAFPFVVLETFLLAYCFTDLYLYLDTGPEDIVSIGIVPVTECLYILLFVPNC